jgi:hypothetical protein
MTYSAGVLRSFFSLACITPLFAASDAGWPRQYSDGNARLVLYQPQVDSWTDFKRLAARFAVSLTVSKHAEPVWGVLSIQFDTSVDLKSRTVNFGNFIVSETRYPSARDEAEAQNWQALSIKLLPAKPAAIALDRVLAYMDESHWHTRETEVALDPPPIYVTMGPAVLVIIDGDPILIRIEGTGLQKVVNTNWDLLFDGKGQRFYLRDRKVWLSAATFEDTWMPLTQLPADFSRLPSTDLYKEALQAAARPEKASSTKLVIVARKPSELIALAGHAMLAPIPDTSLMWATNTECDLFFDSNSREFYFLTSGRWFRTRDLTNGPWTAATASLPADFGKIPSDHARAHVLSAVPGTRQAQEGVMNASIPQVSTIARNSVKAQVKYAGEPKFLPIADTGVAYALNTPRDVLRVRDRYYLCLDGAWLLSQNPAGPWQAADSIPEEIYSIPPDSPKHHVTYVTISNADTESVTYRYSAGYNGTYIANGVPMWGTGYHYPSYSTTGPSPVYWPSPYYTYGASTWYNPAIGAYVRGSSLYGPDGGYARSAVYDPATGAYSWGRPKPGIWGPRYRISSGRAVQTSLKAKSSRSDVYAGNDGNVYQRDSSGEWFQKQGRSSVAIAGAPSRDPLRDALNRDSSARDWGNYNAQRSEPVDKLNGWTGDPFVGRGISGWTLRSPGFGRMD